jgi:hypothetical protein
MTGSLDACFSAPARSVRLVFDACAGVAHEHSSASWFGSGSTSLLPLGDLVVEWWLTDGIALRLASRFLVQPSRPNFVSSPVGFEPSLGFVTRLAR